jgi:hypothetical protein
MILYDLRTAQFCEGDWQIKFSDSCCEFIGYDLKDIYKGVFFNYFRNFGIKFGTHELEKKYFHFTCLSKAKSIINFNDVYILNRKQYSKI